MMCHRCLEQIPENEVEAVTVGGATGPGTTIYLHRQGCKAAPQQTSPERYWRWR